MRSYILLLSLAVMVWAICGAIMGVGLAVTTEAVTLTVHAIGAPVFAALAAVAYQRYDGAFAPLAVAAGFVAVALVLDVALVSLVIIGDFSMFESVWGVWVPMALIFAAAWAAGAWARPVYWA